MGDRMAVFVHLLMQCIVYEMYGICCVVSLRCTEYVKMWARVEGTNRTVVTLRIKLGQFDSLD